MEDSLKSGYITKCGHSRKSWKKRWFVLKPNGFLYYYTDPHCKNEKGRVDIINLDRIVPYDQALSTVDKLPNPAQSVRSFALVSSERTYTCICDSETECRSWIETINKAKDGSEGQKYPEPTYPSQNGPSNVDLPTTVQAPPPYTPYAGPMPNGQPIPQPSCPPMSQPSCPPMPQPSGPPMPQPSCPPMPQPYGSPMPQPSGPPMPQPYGSPMPQPYGPPMPQPYGPPSPRGRPLSAPSYGAPSLPRPVTYSQPPPARPGYIQRPAPVQPYRGSGYYRPPAAPYQSRAYIPPPRPQPRPVAVQRSNVNVTVVQLAPAQPQIVVRRR